MTIAAIRSFSLCLRLSPAYLTDQFGDNMGTQVYRFTSHMRKDGVKAYCVAVKIRY